MLPEPLRHHFQWSDEEEAKDYASSATINSVQVGSVSTNMADINNDDNLCHHMGAQEQTTKAQQETLDNI